MTLRVYTVLLALLVLAACRTGRDYAAPDGPRYAGGPATTAKALPTPEVLRIVSFNIAFARRIDAAIALLGSHPALRGADILLLQEMDAPGTERIATSLGMHYVFYPAIRHRGTRRDFGNAVLSRWPITADAKLILPHPSRYARTHRIATAATLRVGTSHVRVYSTHLGTPADVGGSKRRQQLRAILADAAPYRFAVIGGDLNDSRVGTTAREAGFAWPTRYGPRTNRFGRWDHIFLKGFASPDSAAAGTVVPTRPVSDHHPVWAVGVVPRRWSVDDR